MATNMSAGITPYDFVQQVYYMQEKTLLDFWPSDDKYREVLVEANLILKELEAVEDWTWLRQTMFFGYCGGITHEIVKFHIPNSVHKLSTLNHDCLRLHPVISIEEETVTDPVTGEETTEKKYILDETRCIPIEIGSAGDRYYRRQIQSNGIAVNHIHSHRLRAIIHGDTLIFNRRLTPFESHMVLVGDVQKHIKPFHVCNSTCEADVYSSGQSASNVPQYGADGVWPHPCNKIDDVYLTEIPDPNYVIMATAARHAEGSPPALARVAGLQDAAQRILSQMRQNDAAATDSDFIDWDVPGYIEVI